MLTVTKQALGKLMSRDPSSIGDDALLFAGLGLKSANILELLMMVEDELGVQLDPSALEPRHLHSVETISQFVAEQIGG